MGWGGVRYPQKLKSTDIRSTENTGPLYVYIPCKPLMIPYVIPIPQSFFFIVDIYISPFLLPRSSGWCSLSSFPPLSSQQPSEVRDTKGSLEASGLSRDLNQKLKV